MTFNNAYEDSGLAEAYSRLEFPGTYYLAFRDLPRILREHVRGRTALDFGCGAGRSTRFLRDQGFEVTGIDIAAGMIERARAIDPSGDYRQIRDGDLSAFSPASLDLVLSAFTFDNIPTAARKVRLFRELARVLAPTGRLVNLVSSPDIYLHEWTSFSTAAYPENRTAGSGDIVRIVNTAIEDGRPVEDILWTHESYEAVFERAGLQILEVHRPLATGDEPFTWVNETRIAPWVIYVLERGEARAR
jgi:ubiquinone/menaquinone biosynthesis C-methylase UbiE